MFSKKTEEKPVKDVTAKAEKEMGTMLSNMANLTKQNAAQNIVGALRSKRIRAQLTDDEIRTVLAVFDASVDQSLTSIGSGVPRAARSING
jgi:hypothetical protein